MSDDLRAMLRESIDAAATAEEPVDVPEEASATDATSTTADARGLGADVRDGVSTEGEADGDASVSESKVAQAGRARDASGKFAKTPAKPEAKPSATEAPKQAGKETPSVTPAPKTAAEPAQTPAPVPGETSVAMKAPQHWKPIAREKWAALPAEVQAEAHRVDREVQRVMQENAELRKSGESPYRAAVAPFEDHIRRQGGEPAKAVANMMQFGYALETGSDEQKAQLVAHVIRSARVDIDKLVAALDGSPAAPGRQGSQPSHVDPQAMAAQIRQQLKEELAQEATQQSVKTDLERFVSSTPEFLEVGPAEDGTPGIKALAVGLLRSGVARDYQSAYDKACRLHPDVAPVLAQRAAAKAATSSNGATQRARAAAISVKSEPSVERPSTAADSIRGTLRETFAEAKGRRQ
jgi:hypothetical protein